MQIFKDDWTLRLARLESGRAASDAAGTAPAAAAAETVAGGGRARGGGGGGGPGQQPSPRKGKVGSVWPLSGNDGEGQFLAQGQPLSLPSPAQVKALAGAARAGSSSKSAPGSRLGSLSVPRSLPLAAGEAEASGPLAHVGDDSEAASNRDMGSASVEAADGLAATAAAAREASIEHSEANRTTAPSQAGPPLAGAGPARLPVGTDSGRFPAVTTHEQGDEANQLTGRPVGGPEADGGAAARTGEGAAQSGGALGRQGFFSNCTSSSSSQSSLAGSSDDGRPATGVLVLDDLLIRLVSDSFKLPLTDRGDQTLLIVPS